MTVAEPLLKWCSESEDVAKERAKEVAAFDVA